MIGDYFMNNTISQLPTAELSALTNLLTSRVKEYFNSPDHRKEFEEWYYRKYGKEYVWKN